MRNYIDRESGEEFPPMEPNTEGKHTPTPWRAERGGRIYGGSKKVADCDGHTPNWIDPVDEANAALIVRAVNSHAALLKAAQAVLDYMTDHEMDVIDEEADTIGELRINLHEAIEKAVRP